MHLLHRRETRSEKNQLLKDVLTHVCGPPPSATSASRAGAGTSDAAPDGPPDGPPDASSGNVMTVDQQDTQISIELAQDALDEDGIGVVEDPDAPGADEAAFLDGEDLEAGDVPEECALAERGDESQILAPADARQGHEMVDESQTLVPADVLEGLAWDEQDESQTLVPADAPEEFTVISQTMAVADELHECELLESQTPAPAYELQECAVVARDESQTVAVADGLHESEVLDCGDDSQTLAPANALQEPAVVECGDEPQTLAPANLLQELAAVECGDECGDEPQTLAPANLLQELAAVECGDECGDEPQTLAPANLLQELAAVECGDESQTLAAQPESGAKTGDLTEVSRAPEVPPPGIAENETFLLGKACEDSSGDLRTCEKEAGTHVPQKPSQLVARDFS